MTEQLNFCKHNLDLNPDYKTMKPEFEIQDKEDKQDKQEDISDIDEWAF